MGKVLSAKYLKSTYNKATGELCVKLYQMIRLGTGEQVQRQLAQYKTMDEAKLANPGIEVK